MAIYEFDASRSTISVRARSSLHELHASTSSIAGWINLEVNGNELGFNDSKPVAHLEIDVTNISAGNPLYDRELKRRIDIRRYPTIVAEATSISPSQEEGRWDVGGTVSFRGMSQEYEGQMDIMATETGEITLKGAKTFDIRDFSLDPPKILSMRVYPDVEIEVNITAKRKEAGDNA